MNEIKNQRKKQRCIQHREERYLHALDKVIEGKADVNYVTLRWEKLKQVKK